MDAQTQTLFQMWIMKGMIMPVNPMIRKETPIRIIVDQDKSSMARMRVKSVSLRILNVMAAEVPCARKNEIAAKMCTKTSQRISMLTMGSSFQCKCFSMDG